MKISQMIAQLQAIEEKNGDLEVTDTYGDAVGDPQYIDGECVLCDKA